MFYETIELMFVAFTWCSVVSKAENGSAGEEIGGDSDDGNADKGLVKLSKAERRAKIKKTRKEAKKQGKEVAATEVQPTPQAAVLVLY